jgi:hypothetical protein
MEQFFLRVYNTEIYQDMFMGSEVAMCVQTDG